MYVMGSPVLLCEDIGPFYAGKAEEAKSMEKADEMINHAFY